MIDLIPLLTFVLWSCSLLISGFCLYVYFMNLHRILDIFPWLSDNPWRFVFMVVISPVVVGMLRLLVAPFEYNAIRAAELSWVQQIWAASFWDVTTDPSATAEARRTATDDPADDTSVRSLGGPRVHAGRERPSATLADDVLRHARPIWAIKTLILHVFLATASIFALFLLARQLKPYPDWINAHRPWSWRRHFDPLIRAYMENLPLAIAFQACTILAIDMSCRVVIMTIYLLQWLYTLRQHHRRRSPIFAEKAMHSRREVKLGSAHRVVQIAIWTFYVVFWLQVLNIIREMILFIRSGDVDRITDYLVFIGWSLLIALAVYLRLRLLCKKTAKRLYGLLFKTRQDCGIGVQPDILINRIWRPREGQIRI